jgi:hypothetical protein
MSRFHRYSLHNAGPLREAFADIARCAHNRLRTRLPRTAYPEKRLARMRARTENSERNSARGYSGGTSTSSVPIHSGIGRTPFTNFKGKLLDQRSALKELYATGKRGGFHAFRRFRFAALRKAGVPDRLIKLWMGHSQNLIDRYAAQLDVDITYRREWCEKTGLGFELGELGYKDLFPIRPPRVA